MNERTADKTIFTLRDSGDSSVGIAPIEMTLTYSYQIDRDHFDKILDHLYSLNDGNWNSSITGIVHYQYDRLKGGSEIVTKKWIENYKGTMPIQVSIY